MSAPAWTPGPWRFLMEDLRGGRYFGVIIPDAEDSIDIHESDNGEANAHLIAAAPDLYEALEALASVPIERFSTWTDDRTIAGLDEWRLTVSQVRKARAAMAKARGEPS